MNDVITLTQLAGALARDDRAELESASAVLIRACNELTGPECMSFVKKPKEGKSPLLQALLDRNMSEKAAGVRHSETKAVFRARSNGFKPEGGVAYHDLIAAARKFMYDAGLAKQRKSRKAQREADTEIYILQHNGKDNPEIRKEARTFATQQENARDWTGAIDRLAKHIEREFGKNVVKALDALTDRFVEPETEALEDVNARIDTVLAPVPAAAVENIAVAA